MLHLYELSLESPRESSPLHERNRKMTFDTFFISTIFAAMYTVWYAYTSPSGVGRKVHTLAAASAAWLLLFFTYYMVEESPHRPIYHTVLILMWYCAVDLTYAALYYRGCAEEHNKLRDKSR